MHSAPGNNLANPSLELKRTLFFRNRLFFGLSVLAVLLLSATEIFSAFLLQMLLDIAAGGTMEGLSRLLVYSIVFFALLAVSLLLKRYFLNHFVERGLTQYKDRVFSSILAKNISSFQRESPASYLSMFSNDLAVIESGYLRGRISIISKWALLIGGIAAMAYLNWIVMLAVLAVSSLPILVSILFGGRISKAEMVVSGKNAAFIALVQDLLSGFSVIKSFKAEKQFDRIFQKENSGLEAQKRGRWETINLVETLATMASSIVELVLFGVGAYMAIQGHITAGVVVAFLQLLNYVVTPIAELGPMHAEKKAAEDLIAKHQELVRLHGTAGAAVGEGTERLQSFAQNIEYQGVSFGYEEGHDVLQDISVVFEKGNSYAVVGGSGSGKSTLLNLLLGYDAAYRGSIRIDGKELSGILRDDLYGLVSIMQQNVFIFDGSIHDNITLFSPANKAELETAAQRAGLKALIAEKGYDYSCGEGGANLSGGEKQRIALARCLLRHTPILLVDEGTSSLDNATALAVEEAILGIQEITRIVVTHKLNPDLLARYDQILVMKDGCLVQQGKYQALAKAEGYFHALCEAAAHKDA